MFFRPKKQNGRNNELFSFYVGIIAKWLFVEARVGCKVGRKGEKGWARVAAKVVLRFIV